MSPRSLLFGVMALLALAGAAEAYPADREVPRRVSLGGACIKCDLSGRKLTGAAFTPRISAGPT